MSSGCDGEKMAAVLCETRVDGVTAVLCEDLARDVDGVAAVGV